MHMSGTAEFVDGGGVADELVEAVAIRVVELLEARSPSRLVTAAEVAQLFSVERSWVYAQADRLGAVRLGSGPRARLRFDVRAVARALDRNPAKTPSDAGPVRPLRGRPRKSAMPADVVPLRGRRERNSRP